MKKESGEGETANAVLNFLPKFYDFSLFKNKNFLMKALEQAAFPALEKQIYLLLSEEERVFDAGVEDIF